MADEGTPTRGILSDYETGRLVTLIEWVARGGKPIASCASRRLKVEERETLISDLKEVIQLSGEDVSAYLLPLRIEPDLFEYGVFLYDWALEARIYLERHESPEWLQGFVFGYAPTAIQDFSAALRGLKSKLQLDDSEYTAEIVRPCSERSHSHSRPNDIPQRFRKSVLYSA